VDDNQSVYCTWHQLGVRFFRVPHLNRPHDEMKLKQNRLKTVLKQCRNGFVSVSFGCADSLKLIRGVHTVKHVSDATACMFLCSV